MILGLRVRTCCVLRLRVARSRIATRPRNPNDPLRRRIGPVGSCQIVDRGTGFGRVRACQIELLRYCILLRNLLLRFV